MSIARVLEKTVRPPQLTRVTKALESVCLCCLIKDSRPYQCRQVLQKQYYRSIEVSLGVNVVAGWVVHGVRKSEFMISPERRPTLAGAKPRDNATPPDIG